MHRGVFWYVHVGPKDPVVEGSLRESGLRFHSLSVEQLDRHASTLSGTLLFAEGEVLLRAVRYAWKRPVGEMPYIHWTGPASLSEKPIDSRAQSFMGPRLPSLFETGPGVVGVCRDYLLKLIWPALGEQQQFNELVSRAICNLNRLARKNDTEGAFLVRTLLLEKHRRILRKRERREGPNHATT